MPVPTNSRPQQYDPRYQSYNGMADDETLSSAYLGTAHVETDLARMDITKIKAICEARIARVMATIDTRMFVFVMDYFSEFIPSEEKLDSEDPFVMDDFSIFSELSPAEEEPNAEASEDIALETSVTAFFTMGLSLSDFRAAPNSDIEPDYTWVRPEDVITCVLKMRFVEKLSLSIELLESFRIGIDERGKKIGMGEHSVRIQSKDDLDRHYKSSVDRFQERER